MTSTLSRAEFAELAATAVEAVGVESANGRVHVVPGERMLRYYTTQGVMDRPELVVTANGKEARYGRRHLLQFVAAKRLQAEGSTLPEIRERLAQVMGTELARLAAIPAGVIPPDLGDVVAPTGPVARAAFWRRDPEADGPGTSRPAVLVPQARPSVAPAAPAASAPADLPTPAAAARSVRAAAAAAPATFPRSVGPVPPRTVTVVTLAPGIEVQIDTAIHSPGQVAQLAAALANAVSATLPTSREES